MISPAPIQEQGLTPAWVSWFNQATKMLSVGIGTTAQRPMLGSADRGMMYFDTTLAAAGQPIWFTGTAWVDSTGAAV